MLIHVYSLSIRVHNMLFSLRIAFNLPTYMLCLQWSAVFSQTSFAEFGWQIKMEVCHSYKIDVVNIEALSITDFGEFDLFSTWSHDI